MTKSKNTRPTSSLAGRTRALIFVVAVAVAGTVGASALASSSNPGSTHRTGKRTGIAVLSHHRERPARAAKADSVSAPAGAVLAAVVGDNQIYALRRSNGDDCVINLHVGAGGGSVCAPSSTVEEQGEVGISQEGEGATSPGSPATLRVTVLAPDGVTSVRFSDRDGTSHDVAVTNNVAEREDVEIASVSYSLPGGGSQETNVAAVVDHTPRQPGAAESSR
jgi:hypothetical protein